MSEKHGNTKLVSPPGPVAVHRHEPRDLLAVERLSVVYPRPGQPAARALDGLSLRLAPAEALGVLGASGSGKSTLALALAGLLPARAQIDGRLELAGRSLRGLSERAWRELRGAAIGCVFQQPFLALCPWRRVGRQIADVIAAHRRLTGREALAEARALLEELGIEAALAEAFPHQLSGGQRQRVVFCQAVAAGPRLLIADEPTAALDEVSCEQLLDFVERLRRRRGLALLWISHDAGILARLADRLVVLESGRLAEEGPTARLLASPATSATRELLAAREAPPRVAPPPKNGDRLVAAQGLELELGRGRFWQRRKPQKVLHGIDFELRAGEVVGLYGASGSGKTTLLRCLAGLQQPSGGRLEIAGENLQEASPVRLSQLRRQIQLAGQDPARVVDLRWPLWRIVSEGERLRPGDPQRDPSWLRQLAATALENLGLAADLLERRPLEISGGQLQRAVLARAILCDARAILLDEAFSALDLPRRRALLDLLLELRQDHGLALLFVSHQRRWLQSFCSRTLEMAAGRLILTS